MALHIIRPGGDVENPLTQSDRRRSAKSESRVVEYPDLEGKAAAASRMLMIAYWLLKSLKYREKIERIISSRAKNTSKPTAMKTELPKRA